jgi:hypothetical protein
MARIPEALEKATVLDEAGAVVPLATIRGGRPVVLVFLRHFG